MVNWLTRFENQVHRRGRKTALIFEDETYSYATLNDQAASFGRWLEDVEAERLAIYLPNRYEFFVAFFGALKAGVTSVPVNYMFGPELVDYVLEDSGADTLVTGQEDASELQRTVGDGEVTTVIVDGQRSDEMTTLSDILSNFSRSMRATPQDDDELFCILYTSGTTGRPKGVLRTHRNMGVSTQSIEHIWKLSPDETWVCAAPVYHSAGLDVSTLPVLQAGGTVILHRWDVDRFLREVTTHKPDSAYLAGSMLLDLRDYSDLEQWDVTSLKQIFVGGAPMKAADYDEVEERYGVKLAERLGMTEVGLVLRYPVGEPGSFSPRDETPHRIPGSPGTPNDQILDIRVLDQETGAEVDVGEGRMQVRGDSVFPEYLNQPEKTEAVFDGEWYDTGDIVRIDEDGYFYHVRRADEMIVSGGENVYPRHVESVVDDMPGVKESAVFALPDDYWGERVCAAVVTTDAAIDEDAVIQHCKNTGKLAKFEVPKQVFFRNSIPRTPTRSIRREDLAKEYQTASDKSDATSE